MKILHVISTANPNSGGPIQGVLLQEEISKKYSLEAQGEIVSLDLESDSFLTNVPVKVTALGEERGGKSIINKFLNHYRYSSKLKPWLRSNLDRFDIFIVHGLWNYATFAASQVLTNSNKKYYVFTHGMMDPWFKKTYYYKHLAKQLSWLLAEGRLLSRASSVLFTCEEEKLQARGVFWGHSYNERVVDFGTTRPPPPTESQSKAFHGIIPKAEFRKYILFLGRLHRKKGCDLLLKAFASVADAYSDLDLVMAGPDQENKLGEFKQFIDEHRLSDRVHWTGAIFGEAKWGALYGAEAFILPSHQENFGIAVAEAMACKKPVLISNKVNIWREIQSANAGLVEQDDLEGTISLITRYFELDGNERAAMSSNAFSLFNEKFNAENTIGNLLQTLRR